MILGGACGTVVAWGILLQDGRLPVRFPMWSLICFNLPNSSSRAVAPEFSQLLTEVGTRNISEGMKRGRLVMLTISRPSIGHCVENVGSSTSYNAIGLNGLWDSFTYFYYRSWPVMLFF
jgi:hypothetical protein